MAVCKQPRQGPQRDSCPGERERRLHTAVRLCPSRGLGTNSWSDYRLHPTHQQKLLRDNTGKVPCGLVWLHLTNTWCDSSPACPQTGRLTPQRPTLPTAGREPSQTTRLKDKVAQPLQRLYATHTGDPMKHHVPVNGTQRAGHYRTSSSEGHYF